MDFYAPQTFHIYNQGNNRRQIFFSDENYNFFLWKMRSYLLPFGDLIAFCLMPNHFHWLFYVKNESISRDELWSHVDQIEWIRRKHVYGSSAIPVKRKRRPSKEEQEQISLNAAIGIILQSYAQALNKQRDESGVVFRPKCKVKDGWTDEFVSVDSSGGPFSSGNDYLYNCFRYIHNNPTKAGLVKNNTDWLYSSARDYEGLTEESICNLELGRQLVEYL
ncbi:MAG: hypothetical protein GVY26_04095 [Bacteroidetes bacterium]|jgi:putative transposase|nr:hypothetical protein [Bacteroidota bacterium]